MAQRKENKTGTSPLNFSLMVFYMVLALNLLGLSF